MSLFSIINSFLKLNDLNSTYANCEAVDKTNEFCQRVFNNKALPVDYADLLERTKFHQYCQIFRQLPESEFTCENYQTYYIDFTILATISTFAFIVIVIYKCSNHFNSKTEIHLKTPKKEKNKKYKKNLTSNSTPNEKLNDSSPTSKTHESSIPLENLEKKEEKEKEAIEIKNQQELADEWDRRKHYVETNKRIKPKKNLKLL
jgi:hypothetical protein